MVCALPGRVDMETMVLDALGRAWEILLGHEIDTNPLHEPDDDHMSSMTYEEAMTFFPAEEARAVFKDVVKKLIEESR